MPRIAHKSLKLRFLAVGGSATAIDFGVLFWLQQLLGWPVLFANIISTTTAFAFSFIANKNFTFRSHGANLLREMLLFTAVTLFGIWVLQSIVIWVTLPLLSGLSDGLGLLIAKLLATGVTMVWNYLLYSRVVFKKPQERA